MNVSPTQSNVQKQLRAFLLAVLPPNTAVVSGQINRVAEPQGTNFVVMTPIRFERIETNVDQSQDAVFTGSIAGPTMTITAVDPRFPDGKIAVGSQISGVGLATPTTVTAVLSGTGQVGSYTVVPSQTVSSQTLSAGAQTLTQPAKVTVQCDFHCADLSTAGDMAQTVATLFRDGFAVDQFASQDPNYGVVPLYADDPRQMPFINDSSQYEWRWILEAQLQANQVVSVPAQFSDSAQVELVSVDAAYPPA